MHCECPGKFSSRPLETGCLLSAAWELGSEEELRYCIIHRRRNRGGKGALASPPLSREGQNEVSPPPHFWARTYLKIPPRSPFFHLHSSTVLTPNQSVGCFEKFIGAGTGGAGGTKPPPPRCFSSVWGWWLLMLEAPSGQFFRVQRYNVLHNQCVISLRTNPRAPNGGSQVDRILHSLH